MRLYRIAPQKFLENYSGLGSSYEEGARWNLPGYPVIYFALHPAIAMWEASMYLPSPALMPKSYRLGVYEIDGRIKRTRITPGELPEDWNAFPYPFSTQEVGTEWLAGQSTLMLEVPSAAIPAIPEEPAIIVVNPMNKHINKLKLIDSSKDIYNPRVFQGD